MGVLFSRKHRNGTYTVQFENGRQDEALETHLDLDKRFHRTPQEIENKRKDVIRYTLLFEKTLRWYGDPVDAHGNTKGVPDYEGKIRFSIFSGKSFNEDVANMIACNRDARQVGKCSHFIQPIESPVTDSDILNVYNEQAGERATANSTSSPERSSSPRSTPRTSPGTPRTSPGTPRTSPRTSPGTPRTSPRGTPRTSPRGGGGRRKTKRKG